MSSETKIKKTNTVMSVVKDGLCMGCGTCVGICPTNAIVLRLDPNMGCYIPEVFESACRNCGKCLRVCPGQEMDFPAINEAIFKDKQPKSFLGHLIACYIGHTNDPNLRYRCASGGLITSLLIFALDHGVITGALVTRMNKEKPLEPEPFIARTKEEIIEASKSKYCPVPANIAIKEIINADKDEKFAVVGLPCHIHGIRKAEMNDASLQKKIVLHIGIMCSHTDSFLATEYILRSHNIQPEDVTSIDYRGCGWPGSMAIQLHEGKKCYIPYRDFIWFHLMQYFMIHRCEYCFDGLNTLADLTFGDAWGLEVNDVQGTSLCLARTMIGDDLIKRACNKKITTTNRIPVGTIINTQGLLSEKRISHTIANYRLGKFLGLNTPHCELTQTQKIDKLTYTHYLKSLVLSFNRNILSRRIFWGKKGGLLWIKKGILTRIIHRK